MVLVLLYHIYYRYKDTYQEEQDTFEIGYLLDGACSAVPHLLPIQGYIPGGTGHLRDRVLARWCLFCCTTSITDTRIHTRRNRTPSRSGTCSMVLVLLYHIYYRYKDTYQEEQDTFEI